MRSLSATSSCKKSVLAFLAVLLSTPTFSAAQELPLTRLESEVEQALAVADTSKVSDLVSANRYNVVLLVDDLLQAYIKNEVAGKPQESERRLGQAALLSNIYEKSFKSPVLRQRVALFQRWSKPEKKLSAKADSLNQVGVAYARRTMYSAATPEFETALEIARQLGDTFLSGHLLENIGQANRFANQYVAAKDRLDQALRRVRESENKKSEANVLRELGVVTFVLGDPEGALRYWQSALTAFEAVADRELFATTLAHMGVYYRRVGEPVKALSYYERALKIHLETDNETQAAIELNNMGNLYLDTFADYDEARQKFQQALEIKKKHGEHAFVGVILGNIGICYKNQGDYQRALKTYEEAARIGKETEQPEVVAKNLAGIGAIYADLGSYEKALQYYDEALEIAGENLRKHFELETLINKGVCYGRMKQYQQALMIYRKALDFARRIRNPSEESTILLNMAGIEFELKNFRVAFGYYQQALKIARATEDRRQEAIVGLSLGAYYTSRKDYAAAWVKYKHSLEVGLAIGAPDAIWQAYFGIGNVLKKRGELTESLQNYEAAIETIESIRSKFTLEPLKESFMEGKVEVYHAIIHLLLELGRNEEAFDYIERSKARNLLDILSTDRIKLTKGVSPDLLQEKKEVERRLRQTNVQLAAELSNASRERNEERIAALKKRLRKVRFQNDEIVQQIKLKHPLYAKASGLTEPLTLDEVQRKVVKKDDVLVSYSVTREDLIACVVTQGGLFYETIDIEEAALSALVDSLLQPFVDLKAQGPVYNLADITFDPRLSHLLYQTVFQPVEKYLSENSHLIIVPDGRLHYLPFEALVIDIVDKRFPRNVLFARYESAYAHYLIQDYPISYAHSASSLDPGLSAKTEREEFAGKLLCIGNPDYGDASNGHQQEGGSLRSLRELRNPYLAALHHSQREVEVATQLIKPSVLLTGLAASEAELKRLAPKYELIHISAHARADATQPMYSWIALAQTRDSQEDNFLHAYEVLNQDWHARLVILSACETGLGKLRRGEGLIGLTQAFLYARVPSVVVSLWSVDDASTATFMQYFYQNLTADKTTPEALRQAKLSMLDTRVNNVSYAMPFFWAPFVLVGK